MTVDEIKTRIKKKNLSQRKLAKRFRVSQTAVHFWIHGRLTSKALDRKFAALGIKRLNGEAA